MSETVESGGQPALQIVEAEYESELYRQALQLRREVLRWPLGMDYSPEQLAAEKDNIHLMAVEQGRVVGCVQVIPHSPDVAVVKQVAVSALYRGGGLGKRLMAAAEAVALRTGRRRVELDARATVVPFYSAQGYCPMGEPFVYVTLPHQRMFKLLPENQSQL